MFGKVLTALVLVPLAIVLLIFAIANRRPVTVSFDPLMSGDPALAVTLPLFLILLITLIAGVIIGGSAAWLKQARWRRAARRAEAEVRRLQAEVEDARRAATSLRSPLSVLDMQPHRPPAA